MIKFYTIGLILSILAVLGGMLEGIVGIVICGLHLWWSMRLENKVNNYDMNKVSYGKMSMDSGKSVGEIKKNLVNGKYDKDDKWKI